VNVHSWIHPDIRIYYISGNENYARKISIEQPTIPEISLEINLVRVKTQHGSRVAKKYRLFMRYFHNNIIVIIRKDT